EDRHALQVVAGKRKGNYLTRSVTGDIAVIGLRIDEATLALVKQQREAFCSLINQDEISVARSGEITGCNGNSLQSTQDGWFACPVINIEQAGARAVTVLLAEGGEGRSGLRQEHAEVTRNLVADNNVGAILANDIGKRDVGWPIANA